MLEGEKTREKGIKLTENGGNGIQMPNVYDQSLLVRLLYVERVGKLKQLSRTTCTLILWKLARVTC